jgi:hypothetical protein
MTVAVQSGKLPTVSIKGGDRLCALDRSIKSSGGSAAEGVTGPGDLGRSHRASMSSVLARAAAAAMHLAHAVSSVACLAVAACCTAGLAAGDSRAPLYSPESGCSRIALARGDPPVGITVEPQDTIGWFSRLSERMVRPLSLVGEYGN